MNTRELVILLVGVGLGLAVGLGLWTDQFTFEESDQKNKKEAERTPTKDASSFQIGSLQGSFHNLILTRSDTRATFQGEATFTTPEETPQTIEVSYVDLDSGDAIPIAQALTLLPKHQEQSLSFNVQIPPGKKPVLIRLQGPKRGQMHQVKLSDVQVQSMN